MFLKIGSVRNPQNYLSLVRDCDDPSERFFTLNTVILKAFSEEYYHGVSMKVKDKSKRLVYSTHFDDYEEWLMGENETLDKHIFESGSGAPNWYFGTSQSCMSFKEIGSIEATVTILSKGRIPKIT